LRRRGYPPHALNAFCSGIGVTRNDSFVEIARLENAVRSCLNDVAKRCTAVKDPLKVTLTNFDPSKKTVFHAPDFPHLHPNFIPKGTDLTGITTNDATHPLTLTNVVFIDRSDFKEEDPGKKYFGMAPGKEVKLKYAFNITCDKVVKDATGKVIEILASVNYDAKTKPKGVLTWVSADPNHHVPIEIRWYDHLYKVEKPGTDERVKSGAVAWETEFNEKSLIVYPHAIADPSVMGLKSEDSVQFERLGYFVVDPDSDQCKLVFNLTTSLKQSVGAQTALKTAEGSSSASEKPKHATKKKQDEFEERKKIDPKDMFLTMTDLYSKFDDKGLPTHDKDGNPLSKNAIKKAKKDQDKQRRIFEKHNK